MPAAPRTRVAIAGAGGYIGIQCTSLLERHPNVEIVQLAGRATAGSRFCDVVPGSDLDLTIAESVDASAVDVVVACLPHTVAATLAAGWTSAGALVVDLSADFRLRDAAEWKRWYGAYHPAPQLLDDAVYALPELPWTRLDEASILAIPGCYATAALLAAAPSVAAGLVGDHVVVDGKSGVSGAGRSPTMTTHFSEVNESVRAYSVAGHRHAGEIAQALSIATDPAPQLTFVPHLIPMTRGILATAYLRLADGVSPDDVTTCYRDFCEPHPFLHFGSQPTTKSVSATNNAAMAIDFQGDTAVVTCAIDNLVKGAAGQAIQALNLRMGWPETMGLERGVTWP